VLAPAGCSLSAGYEELPLTASGHAVTATDKGPGIEHGGLQSDGSPAKVGCRRIGANPPYRMNVAIETGVGKASRLINITTGTTVGTSEPAGIVASLPGGLQFMGSCMVTPIEVDPTAHAVWAAFSCDTFVPFDGTDTCALGPSYLFVENCE
jgi:hypothetical protein